MNWQERQQYADDEENWRDSNDYERLNMNHKELFRK